jgi:hypothetical protein
MPCPATQIPNMDAATAEKLAAVLSALRPQEDDADRLPLPPNAAVAGAAAGSASGEGKAAAELSSQEAELFNWYLEVGSAYSLLWDANKRSSMPK